MGLGLLQRFSLLIALLLNASVTLADTHFRTVILTSEQAGEVSALAVEIAFNVIKWAGPAGVTFQRATRSDRIDLIIQITTTAEEKASQNPPPSHDSKVYSYVLPEMENAPVVIKILWDRIAFGSETDIHARLSALLGGEIFGSAVFYSENKDFVINSENRFNENEATPEDIEKFNRFVTDRQKRVYENSLSLIQRYIENLGGDIYPEEKSALNKAKIEILAEQKRFLKIAKKVVQFNIKVSYASELLGDAEVEMAEAISTAVSFNSPDEVSLSFVSAVSEANLIVRVISESEMEARRLPKPSSADQSIYAVFNPMDIETPVTIYVLWDRLSEHENLSTLLSTGLTREIFGRAAFIMRNLQIYSNQRFYTDDKGLETTLNASARREALMAEIDFLENYLDYPELASETRLQLELALARARNEQMQSALKEHQWVYSLNDWCRIVLSGN